MRTPEQTFHFSKTLTKVQAVAEEDVGALHVAEKSYGDSWK